MPVKKTSFVSRSGMLASIRTPAVCAIASTMSTPGMTGAPGKWPSKKGSLRVTFLMPVTRLPAS
jgi:hypothetical protein